MIGPRRRSGLLGPALAGMAILGVVATAAAASVTVHVGSFDGRFYFEDATEGDGKVVAAVGDQLRFVFDDSGAAGKRHAAEVVELGIYSGPQPAGATWVSPVITTAGTFQLVCRFHKAAPNNHFTTLIVTGTSVTPRPTPKPTPKPTPASTARPTPTPGPTPVPSAGSGGGATQGPVATPGGGSNGEHTGAPSPNASAAVQTPAPTGPVRTGDLESAAASASPGPLEPAGELPIGGSGPGPTTWLRSAWVAILALVPIGTIAVTAGVRGSRRDA